MMTQAIRANSAAITATAKAVYLCRKTRKTTFSANVSR